MRKLFIVVVLLIAASTILVALNGCTTVPPNVSNNPNTNTPWGYSSRTEISPGVYSIWFYGKFGAKLEEVYDWALYQAADIGVVKSYFTFTFYDLKIYSNLTGYVIHYIAKMSHDNYPDSINCDYYAGRIARLYNYLEQ